MNTLHRGPRRASPVRPAEGGSDLLWFGLAFLVGLLLSNSVPAQVVHLQNYSGAPYAGWIRRTVDRDPPQAAGAVGDVHYVLGRRCGIAARIVDLQVELEPGQGLDVDLAAATPWQFRAPSPPAFSASLAGVGLTPAPNFAGAPPVLQDGAGHLVHLHGRVGPMLHADLWATVYPAQPWCQAELVLCASNPSVPDMTATVPAGLALAVEGAEVVVPGLGAGAPLLRAGETLGDGQARSWPLTILWTSRFAGADWTHSGAAVAMGLAGVGVEKLGALGPAEVPRGWSPLTWMRANFDGAIARLHTWDAGPLGVTATSTVTGDQEDQGFVQGTEALQPRGAGAEVVRYLVALGQSRRPAHHLEASGALLDLNAHSRLREWDSRAHWSTGVSPDQLGKSRAINAGLDAHAWYGPDRQHWLLHTVAGAYQLTGSPALQWQLEHAARTILFQETIEPRVSTSGPDAARSAGWTGQVVTWLHLCLEDRALEGLVAERWRQRVLRVYVPSWSRTTPVAVWQPLADVRVTHEVGGGYALGWQAYQQAVGAFGMDLASDVLGVPEGRALALQGALSVLDQAWHKDANGRWIDWEELGFADGQRLPDAAYVEGQGAHRTGWFRLAWLPLALSTVLRQQPTNAKALEIWNVLHAEAMAGTKPLDWFAPWRPRP